MLWFWSWGWTVIGGVGQRCGGTGMTCERLAFFFFFFFFFLLFFPFGLLLLLLLLFAFCWFIDISKCVLHS